MKELRFDGLLSPEFYHEINGYDSRIAIMKFHDARETMGFANMSLSYSEIAVPSEDRGINFARAIHLRHALIDLNNSFDLLLQIPWMFYRGWSPFNSGGSLRRGKHKNQDDIVRNTADWVHMAEKECSYAKLLIFLEDIGNPLKDKLKIFYDTFIYNPSKVFTVRTLSNTMKHNHVISFSELHEPYNFKIKTTEGTVNIRERGLGLKFSQQFYEKDAPDNTLGTVETQFASDIDIDIKYINGDDFFFADCTHSNDRHAISDIFSECLIYFDALVDLFEDIYANIYPQIYPSMSMEPPAENMRSTATIDLNKYFIPLG